MNLYITLRVTCIVTCTPLHRHEVLLSKGSYTLPSYWSLCHHQNRQPKCINCCFSLDDFRLQLLAVMDPKRFGHAWKKDPSAPQKQHFWISNLSTLPFKKKTNLSIIVQGLWCEVTSGVYYKRKRGPTTKKHPFNTHSLHECECEIFRFQVSYRKGENTEVFIAE